MTTTLVRVRNAALLLLGVAVLGIGIWAWVFTTQGVWNVVSDLVGGLVLILLAILAWRFHWAEGRPRN